MLDDNIKGGRIRMKFLRNQWFKGVKYTYTIGIPTYLIVGLFLFLFLKIFIPPPDRPIEEVGLLMAYIAVIWCLIGGPLYFILTIEKLKQHTLVAFYRFNNGGIVYITPKKRRKVIRYNSIKKLFHPLIKGTDFDIKWTGSWQGDIFYVCNKKIVRTHPLDSKAGYRVLVNYLKWVREHPEDFKATIQWKYDSDEWRKDDTLKKSIKKGNEKIWLDFLEEWWKKQERGKEYWLKTPLEKILEDLHCPYSLEELENPSEDELVEIDEEKLIEEKC